MVKRYLSLFGLRDSFYRKGSPVIIEAAVLHKDQVNDRVVAQLKIKNITDKCIIAAKVCLFLKDPAGRQLNEPFTYMYLDLFAERGDEFGQNVLIELPERTARVMEVAVTEVILSDRTVWNGDAAAWTALPSRQRVKALIRDQELAKQYMIENGSDAEYFRTEAEDLWFCACGSVNKKEEELCHKCRRRFASAKSIEEVDFISLQAACKLRLEKARMLRLEEERIKEQERILAIKNQEREEKRRSRSKFSAALIAIALILMLVAPWIRLKGLSNNEMTDVNNVVMDEIGMDAELLIEALERNKNAFEFIGAEITKESIQQLSNKLKNMAGLLTDGSTNPRELFVIMHFAQSSLKTTDKLIDSEEAKQLFSVIGMEDFYQDICEQYKLFRPYAYVIPVFLVVSALTAAFAIIAFFRAVNGKGIVFTVFFLIFDMLWFALFAAMSIIGNDVLSTLDGLPENLRLVFQFTPVVSVGAAIIALTLLTAIRGSEKTAAREALSLKA